MDVSFGTFSGRNGWGDQGFRPPSSKNKTQNISKLAEKVPIPANISDLLKIPEAEEKFRIESYQFSTIRVVGTIVNVQMDAEGDCITYYICDPSTTDFRLAPQFTVIRYQGVDTPSLNQFYKQGVRIQAIGKLRHYNSRLSLVSFQIRAVCADEVEVFCLEAKLSKLYYAKNLPKRNVYTLGPLFCQSQTSHNANDFVQQPYLHQQQRQHEFQNNAQHNVSEYHSNMTVYNDSVVPMKKSRVSDCHGLVGQAAKIYQFIQQNSAGEIGVSLQEIKFGIKANENLISDINKLLDSAIIYSTIDDEHFAAIY